MCLACLEGNLQRIYTSNELNMQLDYYKFMFDIQSVDSRKGKVQKFRNVLNFHSILIFSTALNLKDDIIAAFKMMLDTVQEYVEDSNYFTIEFKDKFNEYDIRPKEAETVQGKTNWKQFFNDTFAE